MYILSGSLTSFVCAPSPAHPWPRSARPRLAEPSPHSGGALGNTARTPRRRDWTDGDDWQRPGPRDWLPFRPPAQRGSAPAAPPGPPAPPPEVALAKLRAGPDGAHPAPPPPPPAGSTGQHRAAAASAPQALDGAPCSDAPPCLRLRGRGVSLLAWRQPTRAAAARPCARLPFLFSFFGGPRSFMDEAGKHSLMQQCVQPHTHARPRLCVLMPKATLGEGGQTFPKKKTAGVGIPFL